MENDQCVYARSLIGRLNDLIQGSGNISAFEDVQSSNPTGAGNMFPNSSIRI